ncbi:MAG TPA: DinB family protein [Longimicrobiales bacterium]|nr:DinB family protein [Longimicrobiales bacterium]
MLRNALLTVLLAVGLPAALGAQSPADAKQEFMTQFNTSMEKFIALAEAMPADKFTWSPGAGVMPVGHVYAHVARYNYGYPSQNMGVAAPAGIDLNNLENVRDKDSVLRMLRESRAYVQAAVNAMAPADLASMTRLYGRDVPRWSVLLQLVSHMNEHLGQSIAYARMNGIVPPWSR